MKFQMGFLVTLWLLALASAVPVPERDADFPEYPPKDFFDFEENLYYAPSESESESEIESEIEDDTSSTDAGETEEVTEDDQEDPELRAIQNLMWSKPEEFPYLVDFGDSDPKKELEKVDPASIVEFKDEVPTEPKTEESSKTEDVPTKSRTDEVPTEPKTEESTTGTGVNTKREPEKVPTKPEPERVPTKPETVPTKPENEKVPTKPEPENLPIEPKKEEDDTMTSWFPFNWG